MSAQRLCPLKSISVGFNEGILFCFIFSSLLFFIIYLSHAYVLRTLCPFNCSSLVWRCPTQWPVWRKALTKSDSFWFLCPWFNMQACFIDFLFFLGLVIAVLFHKYIIIDFEMLVSCIWFTLLQHVLFVAHSKDLFTVFSNLSPNNNRMAVWTLK